MAARDAWVALAQVARPHGVRGELRLRVFNRDSDLLLSREEVLLRLSDGEEHEISVESARRANDAILMKLYSVDDRDRADDLRDALVCVRRGDFPPLEDGEFYACDLEGAAVVLRGEEGEGPPRTLGRVSEVRSYPSITSLLVVGEGEGRWEVPLVDAVVASVDVKAGVVTLRTMEGVEKA
jgi:16S rRNA processing protein RimM